MDTEVTPETITPAETVPSTEAPTQIQEYKAALDEVCKKYNLFLNSTLVCTDCGSTNVGTEVRIMEGGVVADPSQPENAPLEPTPTPESAPQVVEVPLDPAPEIVPPVDVPVGSEPTSITTQESEGQPISPDTNHSFEKPLVEEEVPTI